MIWRNWLNAAITRMGLVAVVTMSLSAALVLTVQKLDKEREISHYQEVAQKYASLLDNKLARAEAETHKLSSISSLAKNAQELVTSLPWVMRLEQRNSSGDLVWKYALEESSLEEPAGLTPTLIVAMQEGTERIGRLHYSAPQSTDLSRLSTSKYAQIHVSWQLDTTDQYGLASWSINKLLDAVNKESSTELGVVASLVADEIHDSSFKSQKQWVRLGSTGINLPLHFVSQQLPTSDWQTFVAPVLTLLLLVALGLLYRETYLRQRAEAQAREQQERVQANAWLATLGEIATIISHEINQPLAAIETYAATCERVIAQGALDLGTLQQALSGVRAQAERTSRIIRSVHDFAQSRKISTQSVDVMEVVRELSTLIDIQAKRFQSIVKVQGVSGFLLNIDKTALELILLNLIRNGLEAMARTSAENRLLEITISESKSWLEVAVADTGAGVSPEIKDRLFQPFVTNKPHGTGVGLSLCKSMVEKYRGHIFYANRPTGGSIFTARFPIDRDKLDRA